MSVCRERPPWRSAKRAVTLIELLASSVLASLLMLALVGLLRTTAAQSRAARRMLAEHPATEILSDQIRRDFVNATHIEIRPNRVRLYGHMSQDWRTRRQTFRTAEVTYAVVSARRAQTLVRQETQFSEFAGQRSRLDVLWSGVAGLEVTRFDEADEELASEDSSLAPPGMTPLPARLLVSIHQLEGEPLLTQDIFHHHAVQ